MAWLDETTGENVGRTHPNHRERGVAKFSYTYDDIARLAGVKIGSLYNAHHKKRLDPGDLLSVAEYICSKRGWVAPNDE